MGIGIIHIGEEEALFLYAPGVSMGPREIDILQHRGLGGWEYALTDEEVGLEPGEEKLLGAYRQANDSIRMYDLKDENEVAKMIQEDDAVLLLWIRVDEAQEPPVMTNDD